MNTKYIYLVISTLISNYITGNIFFERWSTTCGQQVYQQDQNYDYKIGYLNQNTLSKFFSF